MGKGNPVERKVEVEPGRGLLLTRGCAACVCRLAEEGLQPGLREMAVVTEDELNAMELAQKNRRAVHEGPLLVQALPIEHKGRVPRFSRGGRHLRGR